MSVELYQQQQAITELQQCEEEMIDQHKLMMEFLQKFVPEAQGLYEKTNYVDYDQDGKLHIQFIASEKARFISRTPVHLVYMVSKW